MAPSLCGSFLLYISLVLTSLIKPLPPVLVLVANLSSSAKSLMKKRTPISRLVFIRFNSFQLPSPFHCLLFLLQFILIFLSHLLRSSSSSSSWSVSALTFRPVAWISLSLSLPPYVAPVPTTFSYLPNHLPLYPFIPQLSALPFFASRSHCLLLPHLNTHPYINTSTTR